MHYAQECERPNMRLIMDGRKAKVTSGCLINVVHIRPRCLCCLHYLGRPVNCPVLMERIHRPHWLPQQTRIGCRTPQTSNTV